MLTVYRRHKDDCPHAADRISRKCRCALWATGTLLGLPFRKTLKTRDWDYPERLKRKIENGTQEATRPAPKVMTFTAAVETFITDLRAQNRQNDTIRKYNLLFRQLAPFGVSLPDFTFDVLLRFRATWTEKGTATKNKKLDRMKAFFRFCHDAGWISLNPAKGIKIASSRGSMVKPFSREEQTVLLTKPQTRLYRCFVHILYYSALRISDACMLRPEDFDGARIRRVNRKNQETVFIPIPPDLKAELDTLPLNGGYYFLQGQSEKHYTQTDAWRTILNDLFKEKMPGFHAHRFRHTAAVNWLAAGLTMEEVAALLGNSVKVVEKHYASFGGARQEMVARKLEATWAKPRLQRVK